METPADRPATDLPLPVVVGVDDSEGAARALRWAAAEALRTGAALRIVNAWQAPVATSYATISTPYLDPEPFAQGAKAIVRRAEEQISRELGEAAPPVAGATVQGPTATALLEAARDASLLVVGTRGRGGFASAVLGSVSTSCAHHTPAPLAIIGPDAPDPGSGDLVVGFDGSAGGRAALRWAVRDARTTGAKVRVVHGWTTAIGEPFGLRPDGSLVDDPTPEIEREVADAVADLGDLPSISVEVVPLPGARALLRSAVGEAALVVGSRGHGGFVGLLLGSVSQSCLHHAPCPLVIVPTPG
jgi:nucleotide-binding universal stress UspA family protein